MIMNDIDTRSMNKKAMNGDLLGNGNLEIILRF